MSSHSRCFYIGVTSHLWTRVQLHKRGTYEGFTKKYKIHYLVYHECFDDIETAIAREKTTERLDASQEDRAYRKDESGWEDLTPLWSNPGPSTPARHD